MAKLAKIEFGDKEFDPYVNSDDEIIYKAMRERQTNLLLDCIRDSKPPMKFTKKIFFELTDEIDRPHKLRRLYISEPNTSWADYLKNADERSIRILNDPSNYSFRWINGRVTMPELIRQSDTIESHVLSVALYWLTSRDECLNYYVGYDRQVTSLLPCTRYNVNAKFRKIKKDFIKTLEHDDASPEEIFIEHADWIAISKRRDIVYQLDFVERFKEHIRWIVVSREHPLTDEFIERFNEYLDWDYISGGNLRISDKAILENYDKIKWLYIRQSRLKKLPKHVYTELLLKGVFDTDGARFLV